MHRLLEHPQIWRAVAGCLILGFCQPLSAQKGPGGVSEEGPAIQQGSTCRLWLDASRLTGISDGESIFNWEDVSESDVTEAAVPDDNGLAPYFRDDPAYSLNGYPVATFGDNRFFLLGTGGTGESSPDLNLADVTYSKTVFFAFRTGTDVQSRQCIYEEGGRYRGFTAYIENGKLIVGTYDWSSLPEDAQPGDQDDDGTPPWGYSYVETPIQPNSTKVLTAQFSAPTEGTVQENDDFFIRAFLNGQYMGNMQYATSFVNYQEDGVGTLASHSGGMGLGAVSGYSVTKLGRDYNNSTGDYAFKGLLAEFCYYTDLLTPTERIIIENYLGAKYFANIIVDDRYEYQTGYGNDVIGIGQKADVQAGPVGNLDGPHNLSKGPNPFTISKVTGYPAPNTFFLTGHNNQSLTFTDQDVPNDSTNTRRLRRTWRVDETGTFGQVKFRIHRSELPALPAGNWKYVLLVDESSNNFPNFSQSSTKVLGLNEGGSGIDSIEVDMADGAFFTIGAVRPEFGFKSDLAYALEGDPPPGSTYFNDRIEVGLNYIPPYNPVVFDYRFEDGSAVQASDYDYSIIQTTGDTITAGSQSEFLPIFVKNDVVLEGLESLKVILEAGSNTTPGLTPGQADTLTFFIYDNDPPPKASFDVASSNVEEDAGTDSITIFRTNTAEQAIVRVSRTGAGNATPGGDYSFPYSVSSDTWKEYTFNAGIAELSVEIPIINDEIDEYNETIELTLQAVSDNISVDDTSTVNHTITIVDEDPEPNAEFLSASGEGFEATGDPFIYIVLDRPSAKEVEVDYSVNAVASTATDPDYDLALSGTVAIPPLDTLGYPPLLVLNTDTSPEPDEDLVIDLTGAVNAVISGQSTHTYTIFDFTAYNWQGAAGIGRPSDDIIWIDADRETGNHNDQLQSLSNFSPRNINISQSNSDKRAKLQTTSNLINGRQTFQFDGSNDQYRIDDSGVINLAGFVTKRSYFMVIKTGDDVTSRQLLYEQGGGQRGMNFHIQDGNVYFHGWNLNEGNWGYGVDNDPEDVRFAEYNGLSPNTAYIISCHFDKDANEKMRIYVNGEAGIQETEACGKLYSHGNDIGLGDIADKTVFKGDDYKSTGSKPFEGLIAEVILFHEPLLTETRRIILTNSLSAKYNIPLNSDTPQLFDLAYGEKSISEYYGNDVAAIGRAANPADSVHLKSQGPPTETELTVTAASTPQPDSYLIWGHNGVPLENTWPYSSANLPASINDRSGRVWKFFKSGTGNVGNVDVLIDFSELASAIDYSEPDLKLLVHTNANGQDFSDATIYNATFNSGYVADFSNINIPDGAYVTLGNSNSSLPLPVELLSFDARLNAPNSTVNLRWATATETNNDFFEVERAGKDLRFESILTREGAGTSSVQQQYSDEDEKPLAGINYYRLKQTDFDGGVTYSQVKSVYVPGGSLSDDVFLYPNPYSEGPLKLRCPGAYAGGEKAVRILTTSGKVVYTRLFGNHTNLLTLSPGKLAPGMYIVSFRNHRMETHNKLIVR